MRKYTGGQFFGYKFFFTPFLILSDSVFFFRFY